MTVKETKAGELLTLTHRLFCVCRAKCLLENTGGDFDFCRIRPIREKARQLGRTITQTWAFWPCLRRIAVAVNGS
jgi:hypothetical protein